MGKTRIVALGLVVVTPLVVLLERPRLQAALGGLAPTITPTTTPDPIGA